MTAAGQERLEECDDCGAAVSDWVFCPGGGYLCRDCEDYLDLDWEGP